MDDRVLTLEEANQILLQDKLGIDFLQFFHKKLDDLEYELDHDEKRYDS